MKWPWRRKCENTEGIKQAEAAVEREKRAGREATAKAPAVERVAKDLAKHKRENNFSQLFEQAMHEQRNRGRS